MDENTELLVNCRNHMREQRPEDEQLRAMRAEAARFAQKQADWDQRRAEALQRLLGLALTDGVLSDLLLVMGVTSWLPESRTPRAVSWSPRTSRYLLITASGKR